MDVNNGQSADDHQSERRRYEAAATALEGREVIYREGIYALIKITGIQVSDWGFEANATFIAQLPVGLDPGFRVFPDGWSFSCAWSVFSGRFETAFSGLYSGWRIYAAAEIVEKARALLNQPNVSKEEGWAFIKDINIPDWEKEVADADSQSQAERGWQ